MIKFNLKKVMKEKKVTLKELSRDTGLSVNTLSLLSTGKSKGIQFDTLEKIIQSLKCNVKDLIVLEDGFRKLYLTDISVNKMGLFIFSEPNDNRIFNISCKYAEDEAEEREILLTIFFTKEFVEVAISGVLPTEFLTSGKYY
ncbi:helix-turn-helix domain-containing protein, partial [Staphylococcus simulans]